MAVKQISVFLENKTGTLAEVTGILSAVKVNIRTLVIADTAEFGVLRLVVDDYETACRILKTHGFAVKIHDMVAVEVADTPGAIHEVLTFLNSSAINVEYAYAFTRFSGKGGIVFFKTENIPDTISELRKHNLPVIGGDEIYGV
ncbi:MAG: amino acid-binding protein [Desulfobacteraceae bacterium]|nr:amino acid-binding protein [Desulfobacteraceae bacterium]